MKEPTGNEKPISRRGFLPILGGSLLIPLLGFGNSNNKDTEIDKNEGEDEYQTLLKPDGTTVKVKTSALRNAKVVKKNISNKSLLTWLGKKF